MNIRLATLADAAALAAINLEVQALHLALRPLEFRPATEAELAEALRGMLGRETVRVLLAEQDGEIAGYAVFELCRVAANAFKQAREYLLVHQIAVKTSHRRQGIASRLFAYIESAAAEAGMARIEIDVYTDNTEARQFYESLGFSGFRLLLEREVGCASPHQGATDLKRTIAP